MKSDDWIICMFFVAVLTFIVLVGTISTKFQKDHRNRRDIELWNDGICCSCGGRYEFMQAVGHEYETWYIYDCKDCGEIIEISKYNP